MHRLLIGQKGQTIREISEKFGYDKVQVDFKNDDKQCGIQLEGAPSELAAVQKELERRIQEIRKQVTFFHSQNSFYSSWHFLLLKIIFWSCYHFQRSLYWFQIGTLSVEQQLPT